MGRENRENEVRVRDCSKRTLLLLLEYLYCGCVDIKVEDALELYQLADRYQETGLSEECMGWFGRGLNDENALDMLLEVDGLGLYGLRDVCMPFVVWDYDRVKFRARLD